MSGQIDTGLEHEAYNKPSMPTSIRKQFKIDWHGMHGANYWARILHNGMAISTKRWADLLAVELFAFLHNSQRHNDDEDYQHGKRAAKYACSLNTVYFDLTATRMNALCKAIKHHIGGKVHDQATIHTCWDADRLDPGRVSIKPGTKFLSVEAVKHIEEAYSWSRELRYAEVVAT